ncbi:hypothetical protein [Nostoc commune]|uniref:hypothetical protein n=1 Tax=Nostoc commune TaxID=1178 RepID=UPI0020737647|nr:hypothetical protein [Nostoc commune]
MNCDGLRPTGGHRLYQKAVRLLLSGLQQLVSHCWSCSGVVGAQFEQSLLSLL